jgi:hypothetical protein
MKLDEIVAKYIKLRDKKAVFKAEYDAKVADIDNMLDKVEAILLKQFEETGVSSVKTPNGTAYTTTRVSVPIADWDLFLSEFVIPNKSWEFLERRASKTAVEQYKEENGDIPPGVNYVETRLVNIRRS